MEENFSINKLKEMIKDYLIAEEDRMSLILAGWKGEENKHEIQEIEEKISEYESKLLYVERNQEILNKVREKLSALEKRAGELSTTKYIEGYYPEVINDLVDEILTDELIEEDKERLGIKKTKVYTTFRKDLDGKLDSEFRNYNADICYNGKQTDKVMVMEGVDKEGKRQNIYYYSYSDSSSPKILSQQRSYNSKGEIESLQRKILSDNGEYKDLDGGSIVYQYDRDGNKKVGLYEDDITGVEYFEYDKDGSIKLSISDDHTMQHVKDGEKEYDICDGYFKPTNNGFAYLSHGSMYDIGADEIKRMVFGNISKEEKSSIIDELSPKRQEEVIDILRIMEPIFEYASSYDSLDTEKREKVISWFKGFSKSLKIKDDKMHNKNEIAEGISLREGEIEEVIDETIAEQDRINNVEQEKEGEAIGTD